MDQNQHKDLIAQISSLKEAIENIKPGRFSWWGPWTGGWLFTIGLCLDEITQFTKEPGWWQGPVVVPVTWFLWPAILGSWVNELVQRFIS